MTDKEDKTVRQFVLFCRTALMYEKKIITMNTNTGQSVKRILRCFHPNSQVCLKKYLTYTMLIIFQLWDMKSA